jgi:hypothetical protein
LGALWPEMLEDCDLRLDFGIRETLHSGRAAIIVNALRTAPVFPSLIANSCAFLIRGLYPLQGELVRFGSANRTQSSRSGDYFLLIVGSRRSLSIIAMPSFSSQQTLPHLIQVAPTASR